MVIFDKKNTLYKYTGEIKDVFMGLEKIGLYLGKEIIALARTGTSKSLLATKPVKVNTTGLKLAPQLESDVVNVTKNATSIENLVSLTREEAFNILQKTKGLKSFNT